jgi:hypothetical protein
MTAPMAYPWPFGPHLHLAAEGIDIQFERLQRHCVNTCLLKFPLQIFSCLIGAILGVAASLILGTAQFFNHSLILF